MLTWQDKLDVLKYYRQRNGCTHPIPTLLMVSYSIQFLLTDRLLMYFITFFVLSVLAFISESPMIYSLFLTEIVQQFDTLHTVIEAVTYNGLQ